MKQCSSCICDIAINTSFTEKLLELIVINECFFYSNAVLEILTLNLSNTV